MRIKKYKKRTQGARYRLSLNRELRCKCGEDVFNSRDLIWEIPSPDGHGIMRLYCCIHCHRVWLFTGHRYIEWKKIVATDDNENQLNPDDILKAVEA